LPIRFGIHLLAVWVKSKLTHYRILSSEFVASLENLAILICGNPRNSGTGANFAAFAKFVACTRITPRTNPRNSATGANLPIFTWAGEVYLMEDRPRITLKLAMPRPPGA
jgi:hypothetical protein